MRLPVSRDQSSVATSPPVLPRAELVVSDAALALERVLGHAVGRSRKTSILNPASVGGSLAHDL